MNLNGMVSMWKVRELVDKATNIVMNYTETEAKVREATNDDPWGPSGAQMQEIAAFTFAYEAFPEAVGMLWKRMLQDNKQNWRRVYKSLLLLDYLLKNGSERVVTSAREHIYDLRGLENFSFVDENGKDQGINIRHKVTDMLEFIQDDDRLREERKKAKKNKDKYVGMSSDMSSFRGSGGGGSDWDSGWKSFDKPKGVSGKWDSKDSDDEKEVEKADVAEFTDDWSDNKQDAKKKLPRRPSGGATDWPSSGGGTETPAKTVKATKPIKKVDLGASATYGKVNTGQQQGNSQPAKMNNNLMEDLFSDSQPKQGQLVSGDADFDDFDPRAGDPVTSYAPITVSDQKNNNNIPATQGDDFADFSSAFSSAKPNEDVDLFGGVAAPGPAAQQEDLFGGFESTITSGTPVAPLAPAQSAGLDLFGGINNASGNIPGFAQTPAATEGPSSMDLLAGLSLSSLPPPTLPPGQMLEATPQPLGPPSLPSLNSSSSALPPAPAPALGSTWSDIGALNSSLLDFSLSSGSKQSAARVPMAAMASAGSSSNLPLSPTSTTSTNNGFSGLDGLL